MRKLRKIKKERKKRKENKRENRDRNRMIREEPITGQGDPGREKYDQRSFSKTNGGQDGYIDPHGSIRFHPVPDTPSTSNGFGVAGVFDGALVTRATRSGVDRFVLAGEEHRNPVSVGHPWEPAGSASCFFALFRCHDASSLCPQAVQRHTSRRR